MCNFLVSRNNWDRNFSCHSVFGKARSRRFERISRPWHLIRFGSTAPLLLAKIGKPLCAKQREEKLRETVSVT